MAPNTTHAIRELKARLAENRNRISQHFDAVENSVNIPKRMKTDFQAHPVKWIALAAGAGFAAKKLIPLVFRLTRPSLANQAFRTAALTAMPLVTEALKQRFLPSHKHTLM